LVSGLAKLIGLPPEPEPQPPAISLPASSAAKPEPAKPEPAKPEPKPAPEDPRIVELLSAAMNELPKIVGAAVVDLRTGGLLAARGAQALAQPILALLGPATADIFSHVAGLEQAFAELAPSHGDAESEAEAEQMVIMLSPELLYVFTRLEQRASEVLVVVCNDQSNLGLVLARLRGLNAR